MAPAKPAPTPIQCSVEGCAYKTPEGIPSWEILMNMLNLHSQQQIQQLRKAKNVKNLKHTLRRLNLFTPYTEFDYELRWQDIYSSVTFYHHVCNSGV